MTSSVQVHTVGQFSPAPTNIVMAATPKNTLTAYIILAGKLKATGKHVLQVEVTLAGKKYLATKTFLPNAEAMINTQVSIISALLAKLANNTVETKVSDLAGTFSTLLMTLSPL